MEMEKSYNPQKFENQLYNEWVQSGVFTAKVDKKTSGFVKVVNEEPKYNEGSFVIKKGSLSVEINKLMNNSDLISLIKAIGECNVL